MSARRSVAVLGSTGSVGKSTLDLLEREPERWHVSALTANSDVATLAAQARRIRPDIAVVANDRCYGSLKDALAGTGIAVAAGAEALNEAADRPSDVVMAAIVGAAGLFPTMRAVERGAVVALANKESLVCAGELVTRTAARTGSRLLPVDSEHNAIFQCFDFERPERISRVILTASGGPFRQLSYDAMRGVTPEQAVAHPVWSMGAKISVDSATLMNKGLELIEAYHLFPIEAEKLDIIVHPQSVVHSLVEYVDGSVLAQLGTPDMRTPISYALAWPDRIATPCHRLDLIEIARLEFEAPDPIRFPALNLAWDALREGGSAPAVLNAANEIAVAAFLGRRIGFLDIAAIVGETLEHMASHPMGSLEDVMAVDTAARDRAGALVQARMN